MTTDTKYMYCPEYDSLFSKSKDIMQERLTNHLERREPPIQTAVHNTVTEIIQRLGYCTFIDESVPNYETSFINYKQIDKLIHDWEGPIISKQYKEKFHKDEAQEIDSPKFNKDAINWLDQSSYKVTGKYFFAEHIKAIKSYLRTFCDIINISQQKRHNLLRYSCIYCAQQLLSIKLKFHRSKQQPLIRNTTLRDSKELHYAFKILYHALDLAELKKIVKRNNRSNPKKKGNKYRVDSNTFAENLRKYCLNLLKKERKALGVNMDDVAEELIPEYFRDVQVTKTKRMDVDNDNNDSIVYPPPKPTPPPTPSSTRNDIPSIESIAPNTCHRCCCEMRDEYPIPIPDIPYVYSGYNDYRYMPERSFIPAPRSVPFGRPMNGYYAYDVPEHLMYYPLPVRVPHRVPFGMNYNGYRNQRGGDHVGSLRQFRHMPYGMNITNRMPPFIKSETLSDESRTLPSYPIMRDIDPICALMRDPTPEPILTHDDFNMENISIASDTASSSLSSNFCPLIGSLNDLDSAFE